MADAVLAVYNDQIDPSSAVQVAARHLAASLETPAASSVIPQDEVTISVGTQATQLYAQGASIADIASSLGETTAVAESQIGQTTLLAGVVLPYPP